MPYVPSTLFFAVENPPSLSAFIRNMTPRFPAATARWGTVPAWSGSRVTPPDPKSASVSSNDAWLEGVNRLTTVPKFGETLITLSCRLVIPSYVLPAKSELPVTKNTFPESSAAGPKPDIQMDARK